MPKSHFGMGILLQICSIFSEHIFLRKHLWIAASAKFIEMRLLEMLHAFL